MMKKETKKKRSWDTPIDELFRKLGLPLTTGNKTGAVVTIVHRRPPAGAEDEIKEQKS